MPPRRTPSTASSPRPSPNASRERHTSPLLSPIVSDLLIGLALLVVLIFVYRGYIIEGKVDVHPDTLSQGAPFNKFADEYSSTFNETPLWDPYVFSGMPFQASGTTHNVQYTYEKLVSSLVPWLFGPLHGRFLFHMLLGGVSMYLLARTLSLSRLAGFVAAVAFVLNGQVIGTAHVNRLACFMHIPLIFLAAHQLFERKRLFYAILLGGAFGSQLGSFHPQIAHYTGMMLGLFFAYTAVVHLREKKPLQPLLMSSALFALALVIAVGMAAVMVWPMTEYAAYSARALSVEGSSVNVPFATSWSFPPMEIFTFIIPSFVGFGGQTYWGEMPFTDFPNYLGVIVVLLALIGLLLRRDRITVFLALLAVCALLVSFGNHFPPVSSLMLNYMPYFSKFRAPVMILILLQFAGALLAGYGVQALLERARDQVSSRMTRLLGFTAVGVFGVVVILALAGGAFQSYMTAIFDHADSTHGGRQAIVENATIRAQIDGMRFELFMKDLRNMAFLLGAATTIILLYLKRKIGNALFASALSGLVLLDLLIVGVTLVDPKYAPGRVDSYYASRQEEPMVKLMQQDPELFRVFPVDDPSSNEYGYFNIPSISGYHAAKLGIYQELMDKVGFNALPVLDMLNTKYLISRRPLSGGPLAPIIESDKGYLYQNTNALPRAFLVDSLKVMTDKNAIFQEMKNPVFNPAQYAIVEKPVGAKLGPKGASTAEVITHTPHRIDVKVNNTATCLLVLSEVYYPAGWTATIDGSPTEIIKTNYVLRSVVVPAGPHTITFQFAPRSFTIGLLVSQTMSGLVLLALIAAAVLQIRKKSNTTHAVDS